MFISNCGKQLDLLIENLNGGYFSLFPQHGTGSQHHVLL
jgi:hypothetical protein